MRDSLYTIIDILLGPNCFQVRFQLEMQNSSFIFIHLDKLRFLLGSVQAEISRIVFIQYLALLLECLNICGCDSNV